MKFCAFFLGFPSRQSTTYFTLENTFFYSSSLLLSSLTRGRFGPQRFSGQAVVTKTFPKLNVLFNQPYSREGKSRKRYLRQGAFSGTPSPTGGGGRESRLRRHRSRLRRSSAVCGASVLAAYTTGLIQHRLVLYTRTPSYLSAFKTCLSTFLYVSLYLLSVCLVVCLSSYAGPTVCLSVCLSLCLSIPLFLPHS